MDIPVIPIIIPSYDNDGHPTDGLENMATFTMFVHIVYIYISINREMCIYLYLYLYIYVYIYTCVTYTCIYDYIIIYTYNLHMYRNRQYIICDTQLFTPSRNTEKTEESADCQ